MKISLVKSVWRTASFILLGTSTLAILSCKSKPVNQTAPQANAQAFEAPLPPPTLDDVRTKVNSIYKGALVVNTQHSPIFLVGDFNADQSQDVVVAVRPDPKRLAELNNDLAAWIVEDPHRIWVPDPDKAIQMLPPKSRPVHVRGNGDLLLIIHGFRQNGWRNPLATQSYLLVNSAGQGLRQQSMRESATELQRRSLPIGMQYLLRYKGDVLRETIAGTPGFLYWTGGHYAWLPSSRAFHKTIPHVRKIPTALSFNRGAYYKQSRFPMPAFGTFPDSAV